MAFGPIQAIGVSVLILFSNSRWRIRSSNPSDAKTDSTLRLHLKQQKRAKMRT